MSASYYIELRKPSARGTDNIIADSMRHLNTRQHLGKAVVVCDHPAIVLSVARKQWLKLSRSLQKQRASTLSADKILKYTHTITRMQRMLFTIKTPRERPNGEVYFLTSESLAIMPNDCWTVYIMSAIDPKAALNMLSQLPAEALVVDYLKSGHWHDMELKPKKDLESRVVQEWHRADNYLRRYQINVKSLIVNGIIDAEAMDDALDTILGGHSHEFLQIANDFQRALELARPLRHKKDTRYAYDSLVLLAHRVQALRPGAYSQHFLELYNENDTFFLYDSGRSRGNLLMLGETPSEAYARHKAAGRHHLARSIQELTGE